MFPVGHKKLGVSYQHQTLRLVGHGPDAIRTLIITCRYITSQGPEITVEATTLDPLNNSEYM